MDAEIFDFVIEVQHFLKECFGPDPLFVVFTARAFHIEEPIFVSRPVVVALEDGFCDLHFWIGVEGLVSHSWVEGTVVAVGSVDAVGFDDNFSEGAFAAPR